jgi:hypothetical protein
MSGPKRTPDTVNTIGIVVVGICGAVLVYVSIVALQAFYMDDSSEIQHMADYGGQDTMFKSLRAKQLENITTYAPHAAPVAKEGQPTPPQTYTIGIDDAIRLVVDGAKADPSNLVPAIGPAVTPSVQPIFGRPKLMAPPAPAPAPAAAPTDGAGAGSSAPVVPTGGEGPAQPKATPTPAQPKKGNAS